ncbi:MAG: NAD(P)-binding domain-containing protein [Alphaproteobacteria bacterium]|nr:NAD(P)-binding domain-containing protein [Alphaproteobacteria bacterium]
MSASIPVIVVGAGPYGLSIAAHLRGAGVAHRIFGDPMHSWRTRMPRGMLLKSEGFASNLSAPEPGFTLESYCAENGLAYAPIGLPVPLATINAYGMAFQEARVPDVENKSVVGVEPAASGFRVTLDDGQTLAAGSVVIATGITYFEEVPSVLAGLPAELMTHSSTHCDLAGFAGREVIVVGAGSSAVDTAALLCDAGASVRIVTRRPELYFHERPEPEPRPLWKQLRYPMSGLGAGLRSRTFADLPGLYRRFPERVRHHYVRSMLGPAGGWFMREQIEGRIQLLRGVTPVDAAERGGRAHLRLIDQDGIARELTADHVIAATGFSADLKRLPFLSDDIRRSVRTAAATPVLSANFESSVPGLYFAGLISANCFGPVMRFMIGADFTARRVARHLARPVAARDFVASPRARNTVSERSARPFTSS